MKKIFFTIAAIVISSCSKDENYKEILQKKIEVTDLEIKDYQLVISEISDREFCDFEIKYFESQYLKDKIPASLEYQKKYLDSLNVYKGNKTFKEIFYFKMKGADTIAKGNLYLNDKDKVLDINMIR